MLHACFRSARSGAAKLATVFPDNASDASPQSRRHSSLRGSVRWTTRRCCAREISFENIRVGEVALTEAGDLLDPLESAA